MNSKEEKYDGAGRGGVFVCVCMLQLFIFKNLKDFTFEFYKTYPIYMHYVVIILTQSIINRLTSFGNINKNRSRRKIVLH